METVAIFGLGFVGFPLAITYATKGQRVIGVDINEKHIDLLKSGVSDSCERVNGQSIESVLQDVLQKGTLQLTTDPKEAMAKADYVIIAVGIPVLPDETLNFTWLDQAAQTIGSLLRKGQTVVLRSTVPPHTTRKRFCRMLENASGLKAGDDFYLGYSSERMAEGKAFEELTTMPTPVAGINEASLRKTEHLLSMVCDNVIPAESIEIVEMSKVIENLSRDVNIAFVNELALFAQSIGLEINKVIAVANTHKRVKLLSPGPGVGGYCIPNAYYYLSNVEGEKHPLPLSYMSRELNESVPEAMVQIAEKTLQANGIDPKKAVFALFGMGMKDYSNDLRHSPSIMVLKALQKRGYQVRVYDPITEWKEMETVSSFEELIHHADCLMILAKQDEPKLTDIPYLTSHLKKGALIVDTRNTLNSAKVIQEGLTICKL